MSVKLNKYTQFEFEVSIVTIGFVSKGLTPAPNQSKPISFVEIVKVGIVVLLHIELSCKFPFVSTPTIFIMFNIPAMTCVGALLVNIFWDGSIKDKNDNSTNVLAGKDEINIGCPIIIPRISPSLRTTVKFPIKFKIK
jgi:hypothetical protein